MKNKIIILLVVAYLFRLAISTVTYHQDLGAISLAGKYITVDGLWLNFYDMSGKDPSRTIFNYQPLAYLIPSFIYLPFVGIIKQTGELLANSSWLNTNSIHFSFLLLIYKLPMIIADIAILFLLPKFFTKQEDKNLSLVMWALNPVAIYVSSIMGQVDIIIALFVTLSLLFYKKQMPFWSVLFISLSALIKPVGLIVIPLIVISDYLVNKKIVKAAALAVSGILFYVAGILPFIGSSAYRHYALFAEQINKTTHASISIASGHNIPFFFITLVLIFLFLWNKKITHEVAVGAALLSSLAFTHFHPQWLVWITPWLIIYSTYVKNQLLMWFLVACWLGVLISFDSTLHLGAFLGSSLTLPEKISSSSIFHDLTALSRAGIIAFLIFILSENKSSNKNE